MVELAEPGDGLIAETGEPELPEYLLKAYAWAYVWPVGVALLDHQFVVSTILWGNSGRLTRTALAEFTPGQRVLQAACVYGSFSQQLAGAVGPDGSLDVVDIVPLQVANCRRKLADQPQARVRVADAADPGGGPYDAVCCFFLLHELPDDRKAAVVDALLGSVAAGGKVVFVDYHKPRTNHPLNAIMRFVFRTLEPYTPGLLHNEIADLARNGDGFAWRKETYFGGLYQKVVAEHRVPATAA